MIWGSGLALMLGACNGTLPTLEPQNIAGPTVAAAPPTAQPAPAASGATTGPQTDPSPKPVSNVIAGFRAPSVVLYTTDSSNDGMRVSAASLPVPMRFHDTPGSQRVEVQTVSGPRWIARSEIVLGPAQATAGR